MKTLNDEKLWTPEQSEVKQLKEQVEIAIDTIRRYVTTLGTILVESNGEFEFNPESTMKIAGKSVDFEIALLENGNVKVKLVVDGKEWKEQQTTEESNEE